MPFPQLSEANAGQTAKPLSLQCQFYGEQIASVSGTLGFLPRLIYKHSEHFSKLYFLF